MPERVTGSFVLLSRFAAFFEEVARVKLAIAEGRLGALLTVGDEPVPTAPAELAARVSGRLAGVLQAQWKETVREGTAGEVKAMRMALYAMAALADELFILEIEWVGRDAWMDMLLEHKLFRSRNAGVRFFDIVEQLLQTPVRTVLHQDLAAVLLMALQLGFKGQFRGVHGEAVLDEMRERLFRVADHAHDARERELMFPQALAGVSAGGEPARLAPLTPWYLAAGITLLVYLVISSALWFQIMEPFRRAVGRG